MKLTSGGVAIKMREPSSPKNSFDMRCNLLKVVYVEKDFCFEFENFDSLGNKNAST